MKLVYLDYEGVLTPWPPASNREYFQSADILVDLLQPYADVKLVLSTSWVLTHSLRGAQLHLPKELQERVIGSTFDERIVDRDAFSEMPRHQQILEDVERRKPTQWLAIDDDAWVLMPRPNGAVR